MKTPSAFIKEELNIKRFVIPYRVYGNGGPQLVFLNGVQQSMAMWQSFISRFSGDYRIVLFDFPGQGKAQILTGSVNVSLDEQVEILSQVIIRTGVENITLISASWGGVVAMAYASRYPQMVRRLILAGMGTKPNQKMIETIEKGCQIDSNERQEMARVLFESFGRNLPPKIKERIFKQFCTMSKENLCAFRDHGLFVISKKLNDVIDFKSIKVETILLNGENDTIIDLDDVKFLAEQIPNCRLKIIKNVGHFLHLENEDVLEIYREVLPAV